MNYTGNEALVAHSKLPAFEAMVADFCLVLLMKRSIHSWTLGQTGFSRWI